ncbi:GNAT family N-acetyltransferase [Boudabousia marimammalium]|uniref:N-acetyltransferase domain-containing protein n=1 Tax=Boudabousia marimammalium TaxID=156892 RepID=A0A1Q5PSY5_9ACTO|nr:GNAT family N-acetyltransferase [Boudabousia marimammalium]OKL50658.1 hypothetical protein BM477_01545 [Boudabousia marimammalium]
MPIRPSRLSDLPRMMEIFAAARAFMAEAGNPTQWPDWYPDEEMLRADIAAGASFVIEDEDEGVHATFMFRIGPDPTYAVIRDGNWLNDELYGTIHRVASDGRRRGILGQAVEFCAARCANLRVDTHADNAPMRHLLGKLGFVECGTITAEDGGDRVAFHKITNRNA